jgi:MFS family permease
MTVAELTLPGSTESHSSSQSSRALDWLNFFLAGVLTGFGPFVPLYLASRGWPQVEIGFVLTVSGLTGLLMQVPGGELLDVVEWKRALAAVGVTIVALAALFLTLWPSFVPVLIAELLLGVTGGFLGPAVTAISLGLVGHDGLPERLGRNQRFAAMGGLGTAGLMGVLGYLFADQAIFFASFALALPTLVALGRIRADDIHFARSCCAPPGDYHPVRPPRTARLSLGKSRPLLIFAACIVLFQLANASVLPLVSEALASQRRSSLVISALIFVPQIVVATLAPRVGSAAGSWGRRPLLLIGLGALPLRAACFALVHDPMLLIAAQVLDGVTAAAINVLTPLIIADIARGTGRFNLAQGIVGTFGGVGAALSTTLSGYVAQSFGSAAGFYAILAVALTAWMVCWCFMPETRSTPSGQTSEQLADGRKRYAADADS